VTDKALDLLPILNKIITSLEKAKDDKVKEEQPKELPGDGNLTESKILRIMEFDNKQRCKVG